MKYLEIRKKFLTFFEKRNHTIVQSSPLIPAQDPTILFTNAGMNQFKDIFLGKEKRSYSRATSMQKCVRAGGKHNDLDEVGFTPRHLTFFEMMGNFSFGDYFKKEAIRYAWDFLTKEMALPQEKLYATVYTTDDESYDIWKTDIGLSEDRISRHGEKDNFWSMGETGPCGPCSEIHIDCGADTGCGNDDCGPGCGLCSRYLEVWNLVFMEYDRASDGTLMPLEKKGVDTGMGFERLCMIMQHKKSVFEIDLFQPLIKKIESWINTDYYASSKEKRAAFHVLCDHVRSVSLLIADGCSPDNEGRGYVLRKIIRRAVLFAQKLHVDRLFFVDLARVFIHNFSSLFPELKRNETLILKVIQREVDRFTQSLHTGRAILDDYFSENKKRGLQRLTGEQAFKLYDTYGFPLEITKIIAQEHTFAVDEEGFEHQMNKQQARSGKKMKEHTAFTLPEDVTTSFVGYETLETISPIICITQDDDGVWIVTKESPFYVESGGQVDDYGWVIINDRSYEIKGLRSVENALGRPPAIAVKLSVEGKPPFKVGDSAHSVVDAQKRIDTVRNHTATHMLQAALIQVLGPQVKQAGSIVHPDYLRFDFTHTESLTSHQIASVEQVINTKIWECIETEILHTTLEQAQKQGVIAFFGEKYNPEHVRVMKIPGFSAELCGGTHAHNTGIIGAFKIISESSLSTGVRRIVALTGPKALELFQDTWKTVKTLAEKNKVKPDEVLEAFEKQSEVLHDAQREVKRLKKELLSSKIPELLKEVSNVSGLPFLYKELSDVSLDDLRTIAQELEQQKHGFYFFVARHGEALQFFGVISSSYHEKYNLRALMTLLKEKCGLRGGGSATQIQGGGKDVYEILEHGIREWITSCL